MPYDARTTSTPLAVSLAVAMAACACACACACARPAPPVKQAPSAPPAATPAAPAPPQALPPPARLYPSLDAAEAAGPAAAGQHVELHARVSSVDAFDGLVLETCDDDASPVSARFDAVTRAKARAALAAGDDCHRFRVRLDDGVFSHVWPSATGSLVDVDLAPLSDPPPEAVGSLLEASLRPVPGRRLRAHVRVHNTQFEEIELVACDGPAALERLWIARSAMGPALTRAILGAPAAKDPRASEEAAGPCLQIDAEVVAAVHSGIEVSPLAVSLPGGGRVQNDRPPADDPLLTLVAAHRAPNEGVGRTLVEWLAIDDAHFDEGAFIAMPCGRVGVESIRVRYAAAERDAVKTLLAHGCHRTLLRVEAGRDAAGGTALTARLLGLDPLARGASRGRAGLDRDPIVTAAMDGASAQGREVDVVADLRRLRSGRIAAMTSFATVPLDVPPSLAREVEARVDHRRTGRDARMRLRFQARAAELGVMRWTPTLVSLAPVAARAPAARAETRELALSRVDREIVRFADCRGGANEIALRVPHELDKALRAIGRARFALPTEPQPAKDAAPVSGCARVTFQTTPADREADGVVTQIAGVTPRAAPDGVLDAFDVARVDPRGKDVALAISTAGDWAAGPRGLTLRATASEVHGTVVTSHSDIEVGVILPLSTPEERAVARAVFGVETTRAVFKLGEEVEGISPRHFLATFVRALSAGTPLRRPPPRTGVAALAAASLGEDGVGRVVEIDASVIQARAGHLHASVSGTVAEIDLTAPAARPDLAAIVPTTPRSARVLVRLTGRDGACSRPNPEGCWAAELVGPQPVDR